MGLEVGPNHCMFKRGRDGTRAQTEIDEVQNIADKKSNRVKNLFKKARWNRLMGTVSRTKAVHYFSDLGSGHRLKVIKNCRDGSWVGRVLN